MSDHTEAAVLFELGKPLRLTSLKMPGLKPGQVRVKLAYSSVCHTQLLEARGKRGPDRFLPHTLGHEASGIVIEAGPEVKKVKSGDHVVLSWIKGLGIDVSSTVYQSSAGSVNSGAVSTFMEETITCENRVTPIPKNMPLKEASLLGCAIPTGAGVVRHTAKMKKGSSVAVFGIGGIGLSVVLGASLTEPAQLIAVDIASHKLELAKKLGATHTVNAAQNDPAAQILEITNGRGVDYGIECAGRRQTMETAFRSVRDQGGLCILIGNLPKGDLISIDPFDLIKGKRIVGTWGGESVPDQDIPDYVNLFLKGKMDLCSLITHEYSLAEINQSLDDLENGKVGRAVIRMGEAQ